MKGKFLHNYIILYTKRTNERSQIPDNIKSTFFVYEIIFEINPSSLSKIYTKYIFIYNKIKINKKKRQIKFQLPVPHSIPSQKQN